jgi:RNA polymerase sigma factor (sigma-70 family)
VRADVVLAIAGDREAFARLVRITHPVVASIALAITRDRAQAEDVTQDAYFAAWLGVRRLRNPNSFLPWLRQLTRHVARSARRIAMRRALTEVTTEMVDGIMGRYADPDAPLDDRLLAREREALLAHAIGRLPDETRDTVVLYYREGRSAPRVAELLGISPHAVRNDSSARDECCANRSRRCLRARRNTKHVTSRSLGRCSPGWVECHPIHTLCWSGPGSRQRSLSPDSAARRLVV